MTRVVVTGASGHLGREVVPLLRAGGAEVVALSRRPRPAQPGLTWVTGDLSQPEPLRAALRPGDVLVHLATQPLRAGADLNLARAVVQAAQNAKASHLLFMGIAGLERLQAAPYYRDKLAAEGLVAQSGMPFTILRTTQFHEFVAELLTRLTLPGPLTLLPAGVTLQPLEAQAAARALADLSLGSPVGHAPELCGPQALTFAELARQRGPGRVLSLPLPVPLFRAWQGGAAVPRGAQPVGRTWAQWMAAQEHYQ
ncbi:NAD(P)H-binding protein [Deinococcus sp. HMF7604]|uniref:SDR family oxidoreductase n=1 Tax=Deinococcus betulae TaxID=2873312 RepID=UPI001CCECA99|nr:NAD(P)H-binding protein [Deinococcus betulae]MBZ9750647.1 NAD(P)H-binding protein [Deinococcus betulae]